MLAMPRGQISQLDVAVTTAATCGTCKLSLFTLLWKEWTSDCPHAIVGLATWQARQANEKKKEKQEAAERKKMESASWRP